jgi:hypothetical protein
LLSEAGAEDGGREVVFLKAELSVVPAVSVRLDISGLTLIAELWSAGVAGRQRHSEKEEGNEVYASQSASVDV